MKSFLQRKMEEEGCDALELAAAMLKYQVGDKGEEIAADEYAQRRGRFGERGRFGRGGDEGRNFGRRGGRRRDNGRDDEEHRERRRFGRGDGAGREDSRDGENSRFGRSDRKRSGRDKRQQNASSQVTAKNGNVRSVKEGRTRYRQQLPQEKEIMRILIYLPQKPQLCFCGKSCIVREECIRR